MVDTYFYRATKKITMGILRKINSARMKIMRRLAGGIGDSDIIIKKGDIPKIKKVLITRPNGRLGNMLLVTPLVQEVTETFPDCRIDLFVKGGLAPILFENYDNVDRIIQLPGKPFNNLFKYAAAWISLKSRRYDLVINTVNYSSSGRLSTKIATAKYKLFGDTNEDNQLHYRDYNHMAKYAVYNFRKFVTRLGYMMNGKPVPSLDLKLSPEELAKGKAALENLTGSDHKTICLFTYATGKKCYPESWWLPFYERLKREFPEYNIIEVLPKENVSQIGFRAPSFYSKDIRQIASLIANTNIFIGADSGIMHLASASGTPVMGLFRGNNIRTYQPYNKGSLGINTTATNTDEMMAIIYDILHKNYRERTEQRAIAANFV